MLVLHIQMPAGPIHSQEDVLPDARLSAIPFQIPQIIPVLIPVLLIFMHLSQIKLAWPNAHLVALLTILQRPAWINVLQLNGQIFCCESACPTVLTMVHCLLTILLPPV